MTMKYWKVTLTCSTPIFVGSGEIYEKTQYIYDGQKKRIYFLHENKWASFLAKHNWIDDFSNELLTPRKSYSLTMYLKQKFDTIDKAVSVLRKEGVIAREEFCAMGKNGPSNIMMFVKDIEGNPYIPGSSVKGAFRTAILAYILKKNHVHTYSKYWDLIEKAITAKTADDMETKIGKCMGDLEKSLTIPPNMKKEEEMVHSYFRGLQVGDAVLTKGKLSIVQKLDLSIGEEKPHKLVKVCREALESGTVLEFRLGIDDSEEGLGHFGIYDFESLQKILQDFINFQYEILKYPFEKQSSEAREALKDICQAAQADLLLGGGTGFINKTILYMLAPDRQRAVNVIKKYMEIKFPDGKHSEKDEKIAPHTLKLVKDRSYTCLLGCCWLEGEPLC